MKNITAFLENSFLVKNNIKNTQNTTINKGINWDNPCDTNTKTLTSEEKDELYEWVCSKIADLKANKKDIPEELINLKKQL